MFGENLRIMAKEVLRIWTHPRQIIPLFNEHITGLHMNITGDE